MPPAVPPLSSDNQIPRISLNDSSQMVHYGFSQGYAICCPNYWIISVLTKRNEGGCSVVQAESEVLFIGLAFFTLFKSHPLLVTSKNTHDPRVPSRPH